MLTGHSLGGAIATIAAAEWQGERDVAAVYTFGQPRVGRADFADFIRRHYGENIFRFVNNRDVVTRVPPWNEHVGALRRFNADGDLHEAIESLSASNAANEPPPLSEPEFERLQAE